MLDELGPVLYVWSHRITTHEPAKAVGGGGAGDRMGLFSPDLPSGSRQGKRRDAMRKQKVLGYYVLNSAGEQVAWHKTRAGARKIATSMSIRFPGIFYTVPEYDEVL